MKRWLSVYAVAFFAFLHAPLLTLGVFSFNRSRFTVWEGFSLDWYRAVFRDPQIVEGTWNSVIIALTATAISTVLGGGRTVLVGNLVQNQFTTARDWPFGSAVSMALMLLVTLLVAAFLRRGTEDLV